MLAYVRSLLVDGVIAGLGGVIVFLPQILILFFFILVLEESGYLPRAAFLLDRVMGSVGLSGRSFIPLLSSYASPFQASWPRAASPATRDRMVTILIAPLTTCSARLPVYALLIGAFIPRRQVGARLICRVGFVCVVFGRHRRRDGRGLATQTLYQKRPTNTQPDDGAAQLPLADGTQCRHRFVATRLDFSCAASVASS